MNDEEWAERAKAAEAKLKAPPPRLTDDDFERIAQADPTLYDDYAPGRSTLEFLSPVRYGRAVEAVVRKQWAKHFGVNDE